MKKQHQMTAAERKAKTIEVLEKLIEDLKRDDVGVFTFDFNFKVDTEERPSDDGIYRNFGRTGCIDYSVNVRVFDGSKQDRYV